MSVIPKIDEPDNEELRELYERLSANPAGILNLFRVVAYNPKLLRNWLRMSTPLLTGGLSLEPRLREIAILRVAQNVRSDYEFGHHIAIARAAGVTDEEIAALKDFTDSGCFSDLERAVIRYTDAVSLLTPEAADLARELRRWLSDRERSSCRSASATGTWSPASSFPSKWRSTTRSKRPSPKAGANGCDRPLRPVSVNQQCLQEAGDNNSVAVSPIGIVSVNQKRFEVPRAAKYTKSRFRPQAV
jgi:alkylhydroperoxidase family enzyme